MRYVWIIHYENSDTDTPQADDALAFSEEGAQALDKKLRDGGWRVDPHPIKRPISRLSVPQLEESLKVVGNAVGHWDAGTFIDKPTASETKQIEEMRELGKDLFLEHDERLRRMREAL
jgi:hypothetical protein